MVDWRCRARVESGCSDHSRGHGWAQCRSGRLGRRETAKAWRGQSNATFRRRGDYHARKPPTDDGVAPGSGGPLGATVTDPVAGCRSCSGRCWPDGDRVGEQVATGSTGAAWQRPGGHSRRLPVGAYGDRARVHGNPGRAVSARTFAIPPGSYSRGDRVDHTRGLEFALAALPLAQRRAGRGPAGSAAAMAALPVALVPRRAINTPVRGHRTWDSAPRLDHTSTRTGPVPCQDTGSTPVF
jgi:hypothetical protein